MERWMRGGTGEGRWRDSEAEKEKMERKKDRYNKAHKSERETMEEWKRSDMRGKKEYDD